MKLKKVEKDKAVGRYVLAYGEVTGHHHSVAPEGVELLEPGTQDIPGIVERFLNTLSGVAAADVAVEHQEHATVLLPDTENIVRTQRQFNGTDIRVED